MFSSHGDRNVLLAVMHRDQVRPTNCGRIIGATAPDLDRALAAAPSRVVRFLEQVRVDERAFLDRTMPSLPLTLVTTLHDHAVGALVQTRPTSAMAGVPTD